VPIADSAIKHEDVDTWTGADFFRLATAVVTEVHETVASISPLSISEAVISWIPKLRPPKLTGRPPVSGWFTGKIDVSTGASNVIRRGAVPTISATDTTRPSSNTAVVRVVEETPQIRLVIELQLPVTQSFERSRPDGELSKLAKFSPEAVSMVRPVTTALVALAPVTLGAS
jgi:hypothetical protein